MLTHNCSTRDEGKVFVVENSVEENNVNAVLRSLKTQSATLGSLFHMSFTWQYVNGKDKRYATAKSFAPGNFEEEDIVYLYTEMCRLCAAGSKILDSSLGKLINERIAWKGDSVYTDFSRITKKDVW
jgi:hypothetical protein